MLKAKLAILKHSFLISAFSTLSTLFAFLVQLILANKYGASLQMDAYFAAVAFPLTLIRFISLPLHFVFVPMYKELEQKSSKETVSNFYSSFFIGFLLLFALSGLMVFLFANNLANMLIAGADHSVKILASDLLRILAFYLFFAGIFFATQVLHIAKGSFVTPYLSNSAANIVLVGYTFFFINSQGIYAPIYGLLLGSIVEFSISFILLPQKIVYFPRFDKKLTVQFLSLFIPFSIGMSIYKSTPIIERYFASFLSQGDIAILGYGNKILESMVGFLATGLSLVLLPITSEYSVKKQGNDLSNIFSWGIRTIGFLVIPTLLYLLFFSRSFISIIFERGSFTQEASGKLALVMVFYLGALLALTLGNQITNIFYAKKRHITIVLINIALLPIYIFSLWFLSKSYGVYGIALSYSLITCTTIVLFFVYLRKIITIEWKKIFIAYARYMSAGLSMILILSAVNQSLFSLPSHIVSLAAQIALGGIVYITVLYFLKASEVIVIISALRSKLKHQQ